MKPRREIKNVGKIVDGLIGRWQTGSKERGAAIRSAWEAAVTGENKNKTQLVNYRNGVLTAIVADSSWLYKLTLEKRDIIEKFNKNYKGRKKAHDVRFRVGDLDPE